MSLVFYLCLEVALGFPAVVADAPAATQTGSLGGGGTWDGHWDPTGRLPTHCLGGFVQIPSLASQEHRHLCQDSSGKVTIFNDTDLADGALVVNDGSLLVGTGDVSRMLKLYDGSVAAILKGQDGNIYIYDSKKVEHEHWWQLRMPSSLNLSAGERGDLVSLAELPSLIPSMSVVAAGTTNSTILLFSYQGTKSGGSFKGELSFCQGNAKSRSGLLSQLQDGSLMASTGAYQSACGIDIYSPEALLNATKSSAPQAPTSHISVDAPVFGQAQLTNGSLALAVNSNDTCELRIYEPKAWKQTFVIKLPGQCGPGGVSIMDKDTLAVALNGDIGGDSSSPLCFVALEASEPVLQCLDGNQWFSNSVNGMLQMKFNDIEHFLISTDDAIWIYPKWNRNSAPVVLDRLDTGSVSAYSMFETEGYHGSILGVGSQEGVVLLFNWEKGVGPRHRSAEAAAVLVDAVDLQHATLLTNGALLVPKMSEAKLQFWSSDRLAQARGNATADHELDVPDSCTTSSSQWSFYSLPPVELSSGLLFVACNEDAVLLDAKTNTNHKINLLGPPSDLVEVSGGGALLALVASSEHQQYYIQRLEFNATSQTYETVSVTSLGPIVPYPAPTLKLLDINSECVALQNDTSVTLWMYKESGYAKTGYLTQQASTRKWVQLKDGSLMGLSATSISRFGIRELGVCTGAVQNSSYLNVSETPQSSWWDPPQQVKTVESLTELYTDGFAVGVMDVNFWRHVIRFHDGQPQWTWHLNENSHAVEQVERVDIWHYDSCHTYRQEVWFVYAPTTSAVWSQEHDWETLTSQQLAVV